jgi:hypothetical protein
MEMMLEEEEEEGQLARGTDLMGNKSIVEISSLWVRDKVLLHLKL